MWKNIYKNERKTKEIKNEQTNKQTKERKIYKNAISIPNRKLTLLPKKA